MSPIVVTVLVAAGCATAWLILYVSVVLPRQFSEQLHGTARVFGTAIELRAPHQLGLTERVSIHSRKVGERLGLFRKELDQLELAVRLRDIGICAIPYRLVNAKSPEYWTPAEKAICDRHPEVSGAMLELVPSFRHLAPIVRWHHADFVPKNEPFYPAGDQIPIASRIINVCSAYFWLERKHGASHARDIVLKSSGKAFDPSVVDAFLSVISCSSEAERLPKVAVG